MSIKVGSRRVHRHHARFAFDNQKSIVEHQYEVAFYPLARFDVSKIDFAISFSCGELCRENCWIRILNESSLAPVPFFSICGRALNQTALYRAIRSVSDELTVSYVILASKFDARFDPCRKRPQWGALKITVSEE